MNRQPTPIAGVVVVESIPVRDSRGSFCRFYDDASLADILAGRFIRQMNGSRTGEGIVRGLHAQRPPFAEMKLVRCTSGRAWDVAVDIRRASPTFLQWFAVELTPDNGRMLIIPEGCLHGFQALEPDTHMLYLHTAVYTPGAEFGVRPNDPRVGIPWPLPLTELSPRDLSHPLLGDQFDGLRLD